MKENNTHQTSQASTALNQSKSKQDEQKKDKFIPSFAEKERWMRQAFKQSVESFAKQSSVAEKESWISQAILQDDLNQVKYLIKSGAKLDSRDSNGNTLLHTAAWDGSLDVAIFLINEGVDLEAKNDYGHTPLHAAVQNGHFKIVEQLVNKGVVLEPRDDRGDTPLHLAVENNSSFPVIRFMVRKLQQRSANLEAKNRDSYTVLQLATQHGYVDLVEFLLASGADSMVRDVEGNTLLHLAVSKAHSEIAKRLIGINADLLEAKNESGDTALHLAVSNNDLKLMDLLLKLGADLETKDGSGDTPLCFATWFTHIDIVKYLVEQGANLEAKDAAGNTPLHIAVLNDNLDIVKYLVEQGADLEAKDAENNIPLHLAILNDNLALINYFAERVAITHEQRDIDSAPKPDLSLIVSDPTSNSSAWANGATGFFKGISQITPSSSNASLAGPIINTSPGNSSDVNIDRVDTNATLLLYDVMARKLTGKKHPTNNFFAAQARANVEAGDRIIDSINRFPSVLERMEEAQGSNRTFKL
ncbi:MAG: hypothetical protein RLZZ225_173 [Pseudomonadota bacterium]|jgi:ankyrin repeat protein